MRGSEARKRVREEEKEEGGRDRRKENGGRQGAERDIEGLLSQALAVGLLKAGTVSPRRPAWPVSRADLTPAVGRAGCLVCIGVVHEGFQQHPHEADLSFNCI